MWALLSATPPKSPDLAIPTPSLPQSHRARHPRYDYARRAPTSRLASPSLSSAAAKWRPPTLPPNSSSAAALSAVARAEAGVPEADGAQHALVASLARSQLSARRHDRRARRVPRSWAVRCAHARPHRPLCATTRRRARTRARGRARAHAPAGDDRVSSARGPRRRVVLGGALSSAVRGARGSGGAAPSGPRSTPGRTRDRGGTARRCASSTARHVGPERAGAAAARCATARPAIEHGTSIAPPPSREPQPREDATCATSASGVPALARAARRTRAVAAAADAVGGSAD